MSISDELAKLNDLKQSGALTSEEFKDAKAKLLGNYVKDNPALTNPIPTSDAKRSAAIRSGTNPVTLLFLVVLLAGVIWGFSRRLTPKQIAANPVFSAVASFRPVDLRDEVQNLPAKSFKGIPLTLPYAGTLNLEVQIIRGNPIEIRLVDPSEVESIKTKKTFRHYPGFEADKTKSYKREGRLQSGSYVLVIIDQSLGVLSATTSDVRIKARLVP